MFDKYTPVSMIDSSLISYKVKGKKKYNEICERCNKEFEFTFDDVKDRVIVCPHCKHDMIFFACNYR